MPRLPVRYFGSRAGPTIAHNTTTSHSTREKNRDAKPAIVTAMT